MSEFRRPSFDEVLVAAGSGAPWALGALFRRFQPGLLRLLTVLAPDRAEDIASDVWIEVAGALPRLPGDERAFRSWLATIARRRVIDGARRHGARRHAARADAAPPPSVARVLSVLSPEEAEVVRLGAGGLDVAEVARALGKPTAAVRSLQNRALRRVARELGPETLSA